MTKEFSEQQHTEKQKLGTQIRKSPIWKTEVSGRKNRKNRGEEITKENVFILTYKVRNSYMFEIALLLVFLQKKKNTNFFLTEKRPRESFLGGEGIVNF